MKEQSSLINRIKSKDILQKILSLAFGDMKSVLNFTKYNKSLQNKLEINIKDYYQYKLIKTEKKANAPFFQTKLKFDAFIFFPILIYIILFYAKGISNDSNLISDYNVKKKNFVDFMNKYILLSYLGFIIISILLTKLLDINKKVFLKGNIKMIYNLLIFIIDLTYFILQLIKIAYTTEIMSDLLQYDKSKVNATYPFYFYDLALIVIYFIQLIIKIFIIVSFIKNPRKYDDMKTITLYQLNGINIRNFELSLEFDTFNEKAKNAFIFQKENIEKYEYKLSQDQINLIIEINDIRRKNNIPKLIYEKYEKLPHFIINQKTELVFYPYKKIYKLSSNSYLFKCQKQEFQNFIYTKEALNIITKDFLNRINIIEKDGTAFISIYNNLLISNINNPSNNNINIKIPHIDEINLDTEHELNGNFGNLSLTEISDSEKEKKEVIGI